MRKLYLLVIIVLMSCGSADKVHIAVSLTSNGSTLKITGTDSLILNDLARDTANHFDGLAPVYKMPADTDMKDYQKAQPGKYSIKNGELLFTPDTAFIKGQT